jgi:hypothetical protein
VGVYWDGETIPIHPHPLEAKWLPVVVDFISQETKQ